MGKRDRLAVEGALGPAAREHLRRLLELEDIPPTQWHWVPHLWPCFSQSAIAEVRAQLQEIGHSKTEAHALACEQIGIPLETSRSRRKRGRRREKKGSN